jgi:hypothetical protein
METGKINNEGDVGMAEEFAVKETEEKSEIDRTGDAMIWISSLANFISWAILVVFVLLVGISVYAGVSSRGLTMDLSSFYTVLNWLMLLLVGGALFVILQMVSKAVFVLLDIHDNSTQMVDHIDQSQH